MHFHSIEEALEGIKAGEMVIVVDDEDRENEGDLVMAAEKVTPEAINFMATYGRGLICMPVCGERLDALALPQMVSSNTDSHETAFTVSIDFKDTDTGISAHERSQTILAVLDSSNGPEDFHRPGHIFPLRPQEGGVLRRAGHTEAAVDLAVMAGLYPAGVICEIMREDGRMARLPELMEFASRFNMKIITIAELIQYKLKETKLIKQVARTQLPTRYGVFLALAYETILDQDCHLALVKGQLKEKKDVLVRVHSECLSGDALGSLRCDCGEQLHRALEMIEERGEGVLLYMRQEGRGIGLANKIRAYQLQDQGKDTVEANEALGFAPDLRDYGIGAQILMDLGLSSICLITNNPRKIVGLNGYGLKVSHRLPLYVGENENNARYLLTKKEKLGHL